MSEDATRARLRRLVILAAAGLTVIGIGAAALMIGGSRTGAWPLLAADLALTLVVLGLAWRALR